MRRRRDRQSLGAALIAAALAMPVGGQVIDWTPGEGGGESFIPERSELERVQPDPALLDLVDRLGSPEYAVRAGATASLLEGEPPIDALVAVLDRAQLDDEQRHRVIQVVRERLINTPRGALGITMRWHQVDPTQPGEVEIIALLPDLPAERVLNVGDRITHIEGRPLFRQDDVIRRVQSRRPGDRVLMRVRAPRRDEAGHALLDADGETVFDERQVDLELGSAELLVDPETGRPGQPPSSVQRDRLNDAATVVRIWGPTPPRTAIAGEASTPLRRDGAAETLVEQHPLVTTIRNQRRMIEDGRVAISPSLRDFWERQLQALIDQADQPGLTWEERAYLSRVAERFAELIPE